MRSAALSHPPADNAFRVLHRDAALTALHINNESHDGDHDHDEQQHENRRQRAPRGVPGFVNQIGDAARQSDNDVGEDQQRHAIADTAFGDLLAQPHDEHAACGQGKDSHQHKAEAGIWNEAAGFFETYCNEH